MSELPDDHGHTMIMTCINRLSEMVQLVPLWETNAFTIAHKFLNTVIAKCSLLECITSNYDHRFHGNFSDKLMPLSDTTLIFSMLFHPQKNGIAKVINHTTE